MRIDEMIKEDFAQIFKRTVCFFLKSAVTIERSCGIKVGRADFHQLTHAGLIDFIIVQLRLLSSVELTPNTLLLIDEQYDNMEMRLLQILSKERICVFITQCDELIKQQLNTLHLHFGTREAVYHSTSLINRLKEFT